MRWIDRVVATVALLAAGCASEPTTTTTAPAQSPPSSTTPSRAPAAAAPAGVNLAGYPPGFRAGYTDGCASVNAARQRDENRFKNDNDYAQGWRDGNDICKRRK